MKSSNIIAVGILIVVASLLVLSVSTASGPFDLISVGGGLTVALSVIGWSMVTGGVIVKLVSLGVREGSKGSPSSRLEA